jgi:large subunit ribosomal protein L16
VQTRMGKGKGSIYRWLQPVKSGSVILEINLKSDGSDLLAKKALKSVQTKLPFKSKIIMGSEEWL